MRENLSYWFSRVQIPRDICARLRRYLYSTDYSWIIMATIFPAITSAVKSGAKLLKYVYV